VHERLIESESIYLARFLAKFGRKASLRRRNIKGLLRIHVKISSLKSGDAWRANINLGSAANLGGSRRDGAMTYAEIWKSNKIYATEGQDREENKR